MRESFPILRVRGRLLVAIQGDLLDATAKLLQRSVLQEIEKRGASGLIIDISGLEMVDSYVAGLLVKTAKMARLMGTETVLCGMQPQVAATLTEMGYTFRGVWTALDVDQGLDLLAGDQDDE